MKHLAFLAASVFGFAQYSPPYGGGSSGGPSVAYTVFRVLNQNTAANLFLPATNAPTLVFVEGVNSGDVTTTATAWNYGTLSFAENGSSATSQSVQGAIQIGPSATSASVVVMWRAVPTSGNVVWKLQGQCVGPVALPAAKTQPGAFGSPVSFVASGAGTSGSLNWVKTTALTITTADMLAGCGGQIFLFRLFRDATDAGDTLVGAAELISATFGVTQ